MKDNSTLIDEAPIKVTPSAKVQIDLLMRQAEGRGRADVSDKLVTAIAELYGEDAMDKIMERVEQL